MVLESILRPKTAEAKPLDVFVIAVLFTAIATWLAYNLFPQQSSILAIAFVTIFFVPFFQRLFSLEERKDEVESHKKMRKERQGFLSRHKPVIVIYTAFFMGVVLTFSFLFPAVFVCCFTVYSVFRYFLPQNVSANVSP